MRRPEDVLTRRTQDTREFVANGVAIDMVTGPNPDARRDDQTPGFDSRLGRDGDCWRSISTIDIGSSIRVPGDQEPPISG